MPRIKNSVILSLSKDQPPENPGPTEEHFLLRRLCLFYREIFRKLIFDKLRMTEFLKLALSQRSQLVVRATSISAYSITLWTWSNRAAP